MILALTTWLGPRNPSGVKMAAYECGVRAEGNPHAPFTSRFYLIAVLFLLLDVEAAFFFPWALVYRESLTTSGGLYLSILCFYAGLFLLGLFYILRKNCLRLS
jgi:NADH-quinone oxidoreductase subunit A